MKKRRTFRKSLVPWIIGFAAALLVLFLFIGGMGTWYGVAQQPGILIALTIVSVLYAAGLLGLGLFMVQHFTRAYRDGLFATTMQNYRLINGGDAGLNDYPTDTVVEFEDLNKEVDALRTTLRSVTMIYSHRDYSSLPLVEDPDFPGTLTYESVQRVVHDLVGSSLSFRNLFAELFYTGYDEALAKEDIQRIIDRLRERFRYYESPLIFLPKDRRSVFLYLPRIDSISAVTDYLNLMLPNLSIAKQTAEGHISVPICYSVVIYPYSSVHEIFQDLRYAKRQGKMTNVYIPTRRHFLTDSTNKNTMYFNQMSKLLRRVEAIEPNRTNKEEVRRVMSSVLADINQELGFDASGIIAYDQEVNDFVSKDAVGKNPLFKEGDVIQPGLVKAIDSAQDPNHSYYFSRREHCGPSVGRFVDQYGLSAGFFFVMTKENQPHGIIYFAKYDNTLNIDSYLQETLCSIAFHIATEYALGEIIEDVVESDRRFDALLSYTESGTYQIEKGTYLLRDASHSLKRLFPGFEFDTHCYKSFYGLSEPCPNCPLLTGAKKYGLIKGHPYATSLTLNSKLGASSTLLIQRQKKDESAIDRFDHDILVNSFPTLVEDLRGRYLIADTGYILLLRVENHASLLDTFNSEGLCLIYRSFVDAMKNVWGNVENVYLYDSQTLAVLFSSYGQTDVLNRCEDIFKLTKSLVYEGERRYDLTLTYLPMHYPQGFYSAEDFLRHVGVELNRVRKDKQADYIYFDDSSYMRPASRREFMLQVIDQQFGEETFHVLLQPIVHGQSRRIFGAEVLLRIQDEQRHIVFFPDELVRVASENGKIPTITKALLRYVSSFYSSIGPAALKQMGFTRLGLNTEVSLFADPTFEGFFESFIKETNFPRDFLSFEIGEREVANHLEEFQKAVDMLKKFQIPLVIDQYTGSNFSMDDLSRLGFYKIKVDRKLVHNIEVDRGRLASLKAILQEAIEKGIETSVVGVENIDQYNLLLQINPKIDMQGFYFYAPLEKAALIDTVRSHNASIREPK